MYLYRSKITFSDTLHFCQGMGQNLAVSTFPPHGLQQNTALNCRRKPKETTWNTKELDDFSFPLVSLDIF